jgi:hypothetical protein
MRQENVIFVLEGGIGVIPALVSQFKDGWEYPAHIMENYRG